MDTSCAPLGLEETQLALQDGFQTLQFEPFGVSKVWWSGEIILHADCIFSANAYYCVSKSDDYGGIALIWIY